MNLKKKVTNTNDIQNDSRRGMRLLRESFEMRFENQKKLQKIANTNNMNNDSFEGTRLLQESPDMRSKKKYKRSQAQMT